MVDNESACNQLLVVIGNPDFCLSEDTEIKALLTMKDEMMKDLQIIENAEEEVVIQSLLKILSESDRASSCFILTIMKDILNCTPLNPGSFVNDNNLMFSLRYLLSLNDHYVVTQALEFVHLYLKKIRVFSFNYMKNLEDKVQRIAERKVTLNYFSMDNNCLLLHFPKPDFMRPYMLAAEIYRMLSSVDRV